MKLSIFFRGASSLCMLLCIFYSCMAVVSYLIINYQNCNIYIEMVCIKYYLYSRIYVALLKNRSRLTYFSLTFQELVDEKIVLGHSITNIN